MVGSSRSTATPRQMSLSSLSSQTWAQARSNGKEEILPHLILDLIQSHFSANFSVRASQKATNGLLITMNPQRSDMMMGLGSDRGLPAMINPEASPTAMETCCSCGVRFLILKAASKASPETALLGKSASICRKGSQNRTGGKASLVSIR